jgi:hypothetical protein
VLILILMVLAGALGALLYLEYTRTTNRTVTCDLYDGRVIDVTVIYRSLLIRALMWLTNDRLWVLTIRRTIFVSRDHLVPRAMRHELEHVRQWHAHPFDLFWSYVRHGGSVANPFERAAREAAGQSLGRR